LLIAWKLRAWHRLVSGTFTYPWGVSIAAIVLLVAALALLAAYEWPRLARRRPTRTRKKRPTHLRVVQDEESDEFARSVERDLANLPTTNERDRRR
jgi:hypothetical protein